MKEFLYAVSRTGKGALAAGSEIGSTVSGSVCGRAGAALPSANMEAACFDGDIRETAFSRRPHLPLITQHSQGIPPATGVIVRHPVDAHADVRVDVSHKIVTMFNQPLDDRCTVDLMNFVMDKIGSCRSV